VGVNRQVNGLLNDLPCGLRWWRAHVQRLIAGTQGSASTSTSGSSARSGPQLCGENGPASLPPAPHDMASDRLAPPNRSQEQRPGINRAAGGEVFQRGSIENPPADHAEFRGVFYDCLSLRADALFELTDAALCAEGPVSTLVGLMRWGAGLDSRLPVRSSV
jgi:hypothetical protein